MQQLRNQTLGIRYYTNASQPLQKLTFTISNTFDPEMDKLRQLYLYGKLLSSAKDDFDDKSQHLALHINGTLASCMRFSPGIPIYKEMANNQVDAPTGNETVDMTRALVHQDYKGLGLYELICLLGLFHSRNLGFKTVIGGFIIGNPVASKLYNLGFENCGQAVPGKNLPSSSKFGTSNIQLVTCDIHTKQHLWQKFFADRIAFLKERGFIISPEIINITVLANNEDKNLFKIKPS